MYRTLCSPDQITRLVGFINAEPREAAAGFFFKRGAFLSRLSGESIAVPSMLA